VTEPGSWSFTARARSDMRKLDRPVQRRVIEALDRLVAEPPQGDIVKLAGVNEEWRLRVGDWRVRQQFDDARVVTESTVRHDWSCKRGSPPG
jgi:mRNA interferase RelE/StbE